jgi:hypothetical protein
MYEENSHNGEGCAAEILLLPNGRITLSGEAFPSKRLFSSHSHVVA